MDWKRMDFRDDQIDTWGSKNADRNLVHEMYKNENQHGDVGNPVQKWRKIQNSNGQIRTLYLIHAGGKSKDPGEND